MTAPRVAIVGAGCVGLACALRLRAEGWAVTVHDAGGPPSASAVAAGMLAPASEAVLDGAGPYAMLVEARDLWAALEPAGLERAGALHLIEPGAVSARLAAFAAVGAAAELVIGPSLAARRPAGAPPPPGPAVFTPEDWRLPALAVLAELRRRATGEKVAFANAAVPPETLTPAGLRADAVVLAAGWGASAFAAAAPESRILSPVKGQLLRFPGAAPCGGPVVRAAEVYLVPDAGGVIAGATMEPGARDLRADPEALAGLRRAAAALAPALADAPAQAGVGVRASTPDGRPLVGPSATPGVWWAAGLRRNGWLLAPLVAQVLAAYLAGRDPGPWAPLLHPRRFDPDARDDRRA